MEPGPGVSPRAVGRPGGDAEDPGDFGDGQAAELVRLRFYAGLPIPEVAQILGVSPRTADRTWAYARAWLHQALAGGPWGGNPGNPVA